MSSLFYFQYFGFVILIATLFALLEIQIEGKHGLAGKLPTWKIKSRFFPNHPWILTGYHVYLWLFLLVLLHLPFLFVSWSLQTEALIISLYVFILGLEDFLWFVFNPHYGIRKFHKGAAWWHLKWWGPMPVLYYPGFILWGFLFFFGTSV